MPEQFFIRINKSDPRYNAIQQRMLALGAQSGTISKSTIRKLYYQGGGANRTGQTTVQNYSRMVQDVMQRQNTLPVQVIRQTSQQWLDIALNEVAATMASTPMAFIHFRRVNGVSKKTRLYIPANLARVDIFMDALWSLDGLTGLKVAGFEDAQNRSDVIVAWFQHSQHAKAVGAEFDRICDNNCFSGVYPPGSRPCSGAGRCGWSIEEEGFSVGTESTEYLAHWWTSIGGRVT